MLENSGLLLMIHLSIATATAKAEIAAASTVDAATEAGTQ